MRRVKYTRYTSKYIRLSKHYITLVMMHRRGVPIDRDFARDLEKALGEELKVMFDGACGNDL